MTIYFFGAGFLRLWLTIRAICPNEPVQLNYGLMNLACCEKGLCEISLFSVLMELSELLEALSRERALIISHFSVHAIIQQNSWKCSLIKVIKNDPTWNLK